MTEQTAEPGTQDGPGTRPEPPRLTPRPLERPAVDAEAAALFGRPHGVNGAFEAPPNGVHKSAERRSQAGATNGVVRPAAQPQAALATAYGRPDTDADPLQRPPGTAPTGTSSPCTPSTPRTSAYPRTGHRRASASPWQVTSSAARP